MIKKARLTSEGFREISKEQEDLVKKRVSALEELKRARELGDLSENAAYKVARMKLSAIDRRLRFLSVTLSHSVVVQKRTDGIVGIGSRVVLVNKTGKITFTLVDAKESDIIKRKVSIFSPWGKSVSGKKKGDTVIVRTPSGTQTYLLADVL